MAVSESRILITNMLFVETIGFAFQQVTASTEPHFVMILVVLICRVIIFPARHEPFFDSISALPSAIGGWVGLQNASTTRSSYHMKWGWMGCSCPGVSVGLPGALYDLGSDAFNSAKMAAQDLLYNLHLMFGPWFKKGPPPLDSGDCFQSLFVEANLVIFLGWYLKM